MKEKEIHLKRITIDTEDFLHEVIPQKIEKDLYHDEKICDTCNGIGLVVDDYPFFIKKDQNIKKRVTKYKKNVSFCPDCYNGVQKLCQYCGEVKGKGQCYCDCEGYQEQRNKKLNKKIKKAIDNAKKITLQETDCEQLYEPYSQEYLTIDEIYDHEMHKTKIPEYMFETKKLELGFDAWHILESELSNHAPELGDMILEKEIEDLQELLDKWCEKQNVYSLVPNYDIAVEING